MVVEMKQGKFFATVLAATVSPLVMGHAVAQEWSFQPRVSVGYQSYDFEIEDTVLDVETDYVLGGLGLTVQKGRFFFDIYGQTNLTEAEYTDNDVGGVDNLDLESKVDRSELNLTLGYAVTPNISVFGGAKYAVNEVDSDFVSDAVDLGDDFFFDIETDYFGPFAGSSFSLPIANVGALALSGSVAYLFGESIVDAQAGVNVIADNEKLDGEAIGFNLGAAWIGSLEPLSPSLANFGYTAGIDYSQYEFEDDGDEIFTENTLRGKVDLKYNF